LGFLHATQHVEFLMRFFGKYFLHPAAGKYFKAYFSATLIWVGKKKKMWKLHILRTLFYEI